MTLGQRISQYRKARGLSQEALGERLSVSRQAVSKWETGAATPDMENLLALAKEFGISVAELTATPEISEPIPASLEIRSNGPSRLWLILLAAFTLLAFSIGATLNILFMPKHHDDSEISPSEESVVLPVSAPSGDFALIWTNADGKEEFLELGLQEVFFPFGTSLQLTEPKNIQDTDFGIMTTHHADCGNITIDYYHTEETPPSPVQDSIWCLSTIVSGIRTPRGIHPGSTKAQVLAAYGDDLIYCTKEQDSYTLVQHDYYYAYQTYEAGGSSLQLFMRDGIVVGLRVEHMGDLGNEAFAPNDVTRFFLRDGEPDFSHRVEPEQEARSDTWKVYFALNQLTTNNNLSVEEIYSYRQTLFGLLPYVDWQEYREWSGTYENPDAGFFAMMNWLVCQDTFSASEILWLQMGCAAPGLDGAYTDSYCNVLAVAFLYDPVTFAKNLASNSESTETMVKAIQFTAYGSEAYPMQRAEAIKLLTEAIDSSRVFTAAQVDWVNLLLLYLGTPLEQHGTLPRLP